MKKLFAFLLASLLALPALAQDAPDALVKSVTDEVLNIVRHDPDIQRGDSRKAVDLVEKKVLPNFNFAHMTALAVGRDWRQATAAQRQRLTAEFQTLLVRTYSNALTSYKDQRIVYKPFRMNPGDTDALVRTEILQPGAKPVQLDYSLEKVDSGWKVYDVAVAGISLVTTYRSQFSQEVHDNGIDGLIASIAGKNSSLEAAQAKAGKK